MARRDWTHDETLMAWALYMALPAKEIDDKGHDVRLLAEALGRTPDAVALKAWNIAAHDERRLAKGKVGMQHGSRLDREVWVEYDARGDALLTEAMDLLDDALDRELVSPGLRAVSVRVPAGTERQALVAQRVNQSYFRNRLLENYGGRCCLTGLSVASLLVASHIKPWAASDPATERLAPDNGLLLNALHDRAFDQGLITLDRELRVVVSPTVPHGDEAAERALWGLAGRSIELPRAFAPRREFVEYHNDVVFRR